MHALLWPYSQKASFSLGNHPSICCIEKAACIWYMIVSSPHFTENRAWYTVHGFMCTPLMQKINRYSANCLLFAQLRGPGTEQCSLFSHLNNLGCDGKGRRTRTPGKDKKFNAYKCITARDEDMNSNTAYVWKQRRECEKINYIVQILSISCQCNVIGFPWPHVIGPCFHMTISCRFRAQWIRPEP